MSYTKLISIIYFCSICLAAASEELAIVLEEEPSFEIPVSQMSTQSQFHSADFSFWLRELHEQFRYHRKVWELCFIAQVLHREGVLQPGKKGVGFGVGDESLPSLFAKYGCQVIASDQELSTAIAQGWTKTDQYAKLKEQLNSKKICEPEKFDRLVEYRTIDMKKIDDSLSGQFDFVWSACSLEHLGSLKAGADFIKNSLKCLRPGGIAVHTTEYNLSSNSHTWKEGGTVIYRRRDIIQLARELIKMGYEVAKLNFYPGDGELDHHVDLPPFKQDHHLKLQLANYVTTSFAIVIRKPYRPPH